MFQNIQPINLAEFGLITDVPSNNTPVAAWNNSQNVRAKDSSVQGVNSFTDSFAINTATYASGKPIAVTQWTPAGSSFLNIAYIIDDGVGAAKGRVFVYNTSTQATVEITSATDTFTINESYPPQIFVFNEILIVNPATGNPQYISADATTSSTLVDLPGFDDLTSGNSYPHIMRAFNNRLVAMNWTTTAGIVQPIDFVWSSVVTSIGSLTEVKWQAATTNTAGDAFLTATPGAILDGIQLGNGFLALKSDAIVFVQETGDTVFPLSFNSIFEDDGIYATGCVANIGNSQVLVVGNYGIRLIDQNGQSEDIAKGAFQDSLYELVDPDHQRRSFVFQQTRDNEVWFCFSSKTNTGAGCDQAFVYDYAQKKLHKRTLPNVRDLFETEINGELKIFGASPDNTSILELSNTAFEADGFLTIEDKSFGNTTAAKTINYIAIDSEDSLKVSLVGTYNLGETITYTDLSFDPTTDYKVNTRVNGRYLHIRFKMDGSKNPRLTTITLNMGIAGNR